MAIYYKVYKGRINGGVHGKWYGRPAKLPNGETTQQICAYPVNPTNPKTEKQMSQRAKFANAVKFYQHATQSYYKFAFEDKKGNESDYNAFMRNDINKALLMDKKYVDSPSFPALGNQYYLSRGTLSFGRLIIWGSGNNLHFNATGATIAELSQDLISKFSMQVGDIVTIVIVSSQYTDGDEWDNENYTAPIWSLYQFILNLGDHTPVGSISRLGIDQSDGNGWTVDGEQLNYELASDALSYWAGVIVSRKTASKFKVTTSYLVPNRRAISLIASVSNLSPQDVVNTSWGVKETAILKGGIAVSIEETADDTDYSNVTITSVNGTSIPCNIGVLTGNGKTVTVVGTNLPSNPPTSSNVAIAKVSNYSVSGDNNTTATFDINQGGSSGAFTIRYAGRTIVSGTVNSASSSGSDEGSSGGGND